MNELTGIKVDPVLFFAASSLLVAILTVGTNPPYGVPRPVLNSTMWQPAPASALVATASFPGRSEIQSVGFQAFAVAQDIHHRLAPAFWVQPSDFSSSVVIPPALLPGDGFS